MTDSTELCPLPHRHDPERPRRLADGARVCWGHRAGLIDDLHGLHALHAELAEHLVGAGGDGTRRGKGDETGIAVNRRVVEARDHIRHTLVSWTLIALEEGPWKVAPADDLVAITLWLERRTEWLLAQDWTPELATNLRETTTEARSLIQPNATYRVELGPCPEMLLAMAGDEITQDRCPGTVVAVMRKAASREQLPSEVRCTEHGDDDEAPHTWGPMQWHALGRRMGRSDHADATAAFLRSVVG